MLALHIPKPFVVGSCLSLFAFSCAATAAAAPVETDTILAPGEPAPLVPAPAVNSAIPPEQALTTPSIVVPEPSPEPVAVAADLESRRLNGLAARGQTPTPLETAAPFIADVPSLAMPYGDITAFSQGFTLPGSKVRLYPHFGLSGIFDDNIYLDESHKVSDFYFALSPGLGFAYGSEDCALKLRADYTASFLLFTKESSQDTVDQNASLRLSYELPKLTLGLNLGFQSLTGASVDVGDRVRRQVYYIGVTSSYVLDEKFSAELNADETVADYKGLLDSTETRVQTWLNYQATGKLRIGAGATFGYLDVQEGPGQTYEELLARLNYDATGKLVLYATAGADLRQSDVTTVAPVFGIGGAYSPFATTTITVDIHERIYGSAALVGQDYRATGIIATLNQQLRPTLSVFLTVGYENAEYYAVKKGIAADRTDNYVFARVGPNWQVRPWWQLGSFYEISNNDSSGIGSRSFTRNRVGVQANFAF